MSNLVTITKGDLHIAIDVTSLLGQPEQPQAPTPNQQVRSRTTRAASSTPEPTKAAPKPKAPKRAKATKVARTSDKPLYGEIRRLTGLLRHDEAIALAKAEGWDHVVKSIESHRAKHPAVVAVEAVEPVKPQPKAPKAPAKVRTPKAPAAPKAKPSPKPSPAKAPATKQAGAKAIAQAKTEPVGNKPQAFPTGTTSESDLVLHWAAIAQAGHIDIIEVAHQASCDAFRKAVQAGAKADSALYMKRLKNLDNLLKQAA